MGINSNARSHVALYEKGLPFRLDGWATAGGGGEGAGVDPHEYGADHQQDESKNAEADKRHLAFKNMLGDVIAERTCS